MMRKILLIGWLICFVGTLHAQQEPQYTQYSYATQLINPAYVSSKDYISSSLIFRTQWLGFAGAPRTAAFTIDSPLGKEKLMGLGLSILHDEIGPAQQTTVALDYGYTIQLSFDGKLAFGIKVGTSVLDVNFNKLNIYSSSDPAFQYNIDDRWQPHIGAGIFYYTPNFYSGISTPNFLETKYFDQGSSTQSIVAQQMHIYWLGGYIVDLNSDIKFKPTFLLKTSMGAPLQWEASTNFMFNEKLHLGMAYRSSAALSVLAGFQISNNWFIGVAYDYHFQSLELYSDGTYELVLHFRLQGQKRYRANNRFY